MANGSKFSRTSLCLPSSSSKYNSIALNLYYLPKQLYPSNYLKNVASSLLIKLYFIYLSEMCIRDSVNRDDYMALAQTWNIFGIPSFVVTQKGQELGRLVNKARKTKEEINVLLSEI